MPNSNVDRGKRTELQACRELERVLGLDKDTVERRVAEGTRSDPGDLIGLDNLTIQVSAVPKTPAAIWARAREKAKACTVQQERRGNQHGLTLLRIDGGTWRAVLTTPQFEALGAWHEPCTDWQITPGLVVHHGPEFVRGWLVVGCGLHVATIERWARDWQNL